MGLARAISAIKPNKNELRNFTGLESPVFARVSEMRLGLQLCGSFFTTGGGDDREPP